MQTQTTVSRFSLSQSILHVPGIGRRTGRLLYHSGVRTIQQFLAIPAFLLEETFGPSLVSVQKHAAVLVIPQRQKGSLRMASMFRLLTA